MNAAKPLSPFQRSAFLASVVFMFRDRNEVGDGGLFRALRIQHEYVNPPRTMKGARGFYGGAFHKTIYCTDPPPKSSTKSPPTTGQLLTNMTALIILAIAILVAALLLNWKRPFLIGKRGENFVSRKLLELDSEHYQVLGELLLPSLGNTNTTQ